MNPFCFDPLSFSGVPKPGDALRHPPKARSRTLKVVCIFSLENPSGHDGLFLFPNFNFDSGSAFAILPGMKRDMDLIRQILVQIEAYDGSVGEIFTLSIDGHSDDDVNYHLILLAEAGLIDAVSAETFDSTDVEVRRLTWAGHEFLDSARSNKIWDGAKAYAIKTTGSLSLEALKLAIPHVMKTLMDALPH